MSIILFIIVVVLIAMIISSTVRIVPQAHAYVVERLGAYQGTWSVGLHVKVPFIDRVARKVNLKEQVVDFPPQPVSTKDNVTMQIDTVVYFQITDPKLYSYGVETVSYTHLDVYKRQVNRLGSSFMISDDENLIFDLEKRYGKENIRIRSLGI